MWGRTKTMIPLYVNLNSDLLIDVVNFYFVEEFEIVTYLIWTQTIHIQGV